MKGPDPVDNAGERRIPRGGSLQESEFRVWPAAIDPQTPTVPGAKRPPGFSHHSGAPGAQRGMDPPRSNQAGRQHKGDTTRGGGYGGGSSVAGSRVPPLRWVNPPGVEVRRKAATIRTGEGISLAGKMRR